ncbi:MAG: hypothetical protein H6705_17155, partial [Myxococcales bacterium]|nr:hypothetical protein [Myxococcales bacterium]
MRRLIALALLLLACEELPPGELVRDWPDALDRDAALLDAEADLSPLDVAPDLGPDDAALPLDLTPPPDRDPPPPICARDDRDGDGYGTDPACPTPDCDDDNR